jgi:hypothetical protein
MFSNANQFQYLALVSFLSLPPSVLDHNLSSLFNNDTTLVAVCLHFVVGCVLLILEIFNVFSHCRATANGELGRMF